MLEVAAALLFDRNNKLLIYLRDDKPSISFPNHWDLFGGMVDEGETPDQALVREIKEELGLDIPLSDYIKWKTFDCLTGDSKPNVKHVYYTQIDVVPEDLELLDCGQRLTSIFLDERHDYKFGSIHNRILDEFANSGIVVNATCMNKKLVG